MASNEEWLADRIQSIKGKKNPTEQETMLVTLAEMPGRDDEDEKILSALIRAEKAEMVARKTRTAATKRLNAKAEEARKLETGQKIILGGFFLHELRTNQKTREWFLREWESKITRDNDQKRLTPLLEELRGLDSSSRIL